MANLPWLEIVQQRLVKHGLPASYIARFMEELTDHFHDLTEETMSTEASVFSRLGEPNQVAQTAAVAYRRRTFLGRHPAVAFLVFGVSPVLSLSALCVVMWASLEGTGIDDWIIVYLSRFESSATVILYLLSLWWVVVPSILAGLFYCKLAKHLGIGRKWKLLACIVLAIVAVQPRLMVWQTSVLLGFPILPLHIGEQPGNYVWLFGEPRQLLQFFVPLAVGLWFMRRKGEQCQESRLRLAA
jgi:hypothetical protein